MNRHTINDGATKYTRISKRQAEKLFNDGKSFYIIAHKMRPGFPFSMGMTIFPDHYREENRSFDWMLSNFSFYNCTYETGYYAAFYVTSEVK